ncbi:MAG: FeoC-like transcriptional regulator [Hydrogenovibrio sp.]
MILLELKHYIRTHRNVAEHNLLHRFDVSATTLQGLLQPLIDQGHVQVVNDFATCSSGCRTGCTLSNAEPHYLWSDLRQRALQIPVEILTP